MKALKGRMKRYLTYGNERATGVKLRHIYIYIYIDNINAFLMLKNLSEDAFYFLFFFSSACGMSIEKSRAGN